MNNSIKLSFIFYLVFSSNLFSQDNSYSEEDYKLVIRFATEKIGEDSLQNIEYLKSRGEAYFALGDTIKALKDFDSYLKVKPKDGYAYYNRGIIKKELKDYPGAINDFTAALQYSSNLSSDIYFARGSVYEYLEDSTKAISDYKNAIAYNNKNTGALNNLALIFINKSKYSLAIKYLNEALNLDPNRINTLYNRAHALTELGEYEKAKLDLNQALDLDPDNAYANNYMGYLLYKQNKKKEACKYFRIAKEQHVEPLLINFELCE